MTGCQCREAGVTTGTYDHSGLKFTNDLLAAVDGSDHIGNRLNVLLDALHIELAAHTGSLKGLQFKARSGHQFLLHMALCANEEDLAVGVTFFPYIRNCDGRIDMSGSTTASKDHIHRKSSCLFALFR